MAAEYSFKGYNNVIIQEKIKSILSTKQDMSKFMTLDYSLVNKPGMTVKVHKYTGTGEVDDLARGDGNTHFIDAEFNEETYVASRTQGQAKYYDIDQMTDPVLIDAKVKYLAEGMVNDWTAKSIAEFNKSWNQAVFSSYAPENFYDAVAKYTNEYEDQEGLYFLCNIEEVPKIRKMLGDELKYVEAYIRQGAIGTIAGVPLYFSKAVPKGILFLASREAVTAYVKRDVSVEQNRNIDTKENYIVATRYGIIALTDETKCIKCGKAQTTALTCTTYTAGAKTIAGAAVTGAKVTAYLWNTTSQTWVKTGAVVTAASNAYSITADENLASGDKVRVISEIEGFLPSRVDVEVA